MIRLLAALAVLLASLSVASARGEMVICTGLGVVSVPLAPGAIGPDGLPAPPEPCPDGVLAFAAPPDAPDVVLALGPVRAVSSAPLPLGRAGPSARAPRARDPPRAS